MDGGLRRHDVHGWQRHRDCERHDLGGCDAGGGQDGVGHAHGGRHRWARLAGHSEQRGLLQPDGHSKHVFAVCSQSHPCHRRLGRAERGRHRGSGEQSRARQHHERRCHRHDCQSDRRDHHRRRADHCGHDCGVGGQRAGNISTGTLSASRLPTSGVTAGTYTSVTVDTYGRVTAGSNPSSGGKSLGLILALT
ncbi:MAG: hypothetical protein EBR82_80985 [Caulobacteraceae bacterium]|nr:hypothetical protein [Caulobacteraceae bacterium]